MAKYNRSRCVSLAQQLLQLRNTYPDLIDQIDISRSELRCLIRLQPTPESVIYKVRIGLRLGGTPTAQIIEPKNLAKVNGMKPHHLFNRSVDGKERLCVYYPKDHNWNDNSFLADSYIPWVITWLSAYETWQITNLWVYPECIDEKQKTNKKKE